MAPTNLGRTEPKPEIPTPVARCYTCGAEKPIYDFLYKRKDKGASGSTIKRWFKLWKSGKPSKTTGTPKYQYRCVVPLAGSCPKPRARTPTQIRAPNAQVQLTLSYHGSSQPTSRQSFQLYAEQPEMTPELWAAREEYYAYRKASARERENLYEYTPGGLAIPKYREAEKYSDRWMRDNDLW